MKVGFVVLTYNRPDALLAVLEGLAPQCPRDAVVVVADDGSGPQTLEALRSRLPGFGGAVEHVWQPDRGFTAARARNLGAAHAAALGTDYIVFLDGDCVPNRHFVRAHLALAHARAFVNGSRVLLGEAFTERALAQRLRLSRLGTVEWLRLRAQGDVNKLSHLFTWTAAPGRETERFKWHGIKSCNFALWYRDLFAVNGFDETFSGWGHEDADLVLRLHHAGLVRRDGWWGTEVFHLWHPENSREGEGANRERVQLREHTGIVRAERGLAELARSEAPVVTQLN